MSVGDFLLVVAILAAAISAAIWVLTDLERIGRQLDRLVPPEDER